MPSCIRPLVPILLLSAPHCMAQGGYGEQALRSNLSPLPYCATEGGRDLHRFAAATVNRYRLYDFYARQAAHELANPSPAGTVLPPFPGLDGGRRGHWGVTNEKSTTAFSRDKSPEFPTAFSRKGDGLLLLRSGGAIISYGTLQPGLLSLTPKATPRAPEHAFDKGADRFGLDLQISESASLQGNVPDWSRDGTPAARYAGYHLHDEQGIVRWSLGSGTLLEQPSVIDDASLGCLLLREFEFIGEVPPELDLALPRVGLQANGPHPAIRLEAREDMLRADLDEGGKAACHLLAPGNGVKVEAAIDARHLKVSGLRPGSRLILASWSGGSPIPPAVDERLRQELRVHGATPPPSSRTSGGPSRYPAPLKVSGRLDADPAASGGDYEIDDVPVPSENPLHAPMTLSGLAFDENGTAYLSTLVGDVWKVTGLSGDLRDVEWKCFARGLDLPLGVIVVKGAPVVNTRRNLIRLLDLNGDGEADFHERLNQMDLPTADATGHDLQTDAAGNLHFNALPGIYRLSPDGSVLTRTGHGSRNPLGLGVRPDGLALSDSSEGENNGTCSIFESDSPENASSSAKLRRILYLPRGVDNSPGGRLFLQDPRMGPVGRGILGVSFGTGTWYTMLRDVVEDTPQAAMIPMPGEFSSGACRLAANPLDGQVFVAGLDGWGDYGVTEGCLHRIRFTGRKITRISGWKACRNGIELTFTQPIQAPAANRFLVQQWNVIDSPQTYGSPEYSVLHPEQIGHDRLEVRSVRLLPGHQSVFLEIPALQPAMCTQVFGSLTGADGAQVGVDLYATLNRLHPDSKAAAPTPQGKPGVLRVPEKPANGNTYQQLVEHFDKLSGRSTTARTVGPSAPRPDGPVTYRWIKETLIEKQCLPCHMTGTQHDLTTRQGLLTKVNLAEPSKSPILGMIGTSSMPPYPLPTVAPELQQAVLDWIKAGAPE